MSKPGSAAEAYLKALGKDVLLVSAFAAVGLAAYLWYGYFFDANPDYRPIFDDGLDNANRVVLGLLMAASAYLMVTQYQEMQMLSRPPATLEAFQSQHWAPGSRFSDGRWKPHEWLTSRGANLGTGAFVLGPDAKFVPSRSKVEIAGAGRDLYRENKDKFNEKVARSRHAKAEQHARLYAVARPEVHHAVRPGVTGGDSQSGQYTPDPRASHTLYPHYAYYYPSFAHT